MYSLICFNNQLKILDFSKNINLTELECGINQLTSLNIKNGNNSNMQFFGFSSNYNLGCIQVDDVIYAKRRWAEIEKKVYFSENCN